MAGLFTRTGSLSHNNAYMYTLFLNLCVIVCINGPRGCFAAETMAGKYSITHSLGRGASGCAFLARRNSDGLSVVIKQVALATMSHEQRQKAVNEVQVMMQMDHMNVVRYLDSYEQDDALNIVLEYAPHGDLSTLIQQRAEAQKPFTEDEVMFWGVQVTLALWHVHSKNVLHRDLKSSNVFISRGGVAKLGDFGIARALSSDTDVASTMVGTPFYLSPEICEDQPYQKKSDIWSLGCILYELCTLRRPFEANNLPALVMKILGGKYPPVATRYSSSLRQLVDMCLQVDPKERLGSDQILQMDYVRYHLARYAQHVMNLTRPNPVSAPLHIPDARPQQVTGTPATAAQKQQQQPGAGPSTPASRPAAAAQPATSATAAAATTTPGGARTAAAAAAVSVGGAGTPAEAAPSPRARGRHQQLEDGWLEAQQAALDEMQAMLAGLNGRGRNSPAPPVAGEAITPTPATRGPRQAAAAGTAAPVVGSSGGSGLQQQPSTPPAAQPAASGGPLDPRVEPTASAAAAATPVSSAKTRATRAPAAAIAKGTPKQATPGQLLPAVPKAPAGAPDLGLEQLAAAGHLGMDGIQIPGMTDGNCGGRQPARVKGLAPKQMQQQRVIAVAKQNRMSEKQQYKQLQQAAAKDEEAKRAARAAELEAALKDKADRKEKERQQAQEAASAHKRVLKQAHARIDRAALQQLGKQFQKQLELQQQQAAAGNGLVLHVPLDGEVSQQQSRRSSRSCGSGSGPPSTEPSSCSSKGHPHPASNHQPQHAGSSSSSSSSRRVSGSSTSAHLVGAQPHGSSPAAGTPPQQQATSQVTSGPTAAAAAAAGAAAGTREQEHFNPAAVAARCNPQMLQVLGQIHDVLAAGGVAFVVGSTTSAAAKRASQH